MSYQRGQGYLANIPKNQNVTTVQKHKHYKKYTPNYKSNATFV